MFGLGGQEILLLACCGAVVPIGIAVLVVALTRRSARDRALEDENRDLRRRLDDRRDRSTPDDEPNR